MRRKPVIATALGVGLVLAASAAAASLNFANFSDVSKLHLNGTAQQVVDFLRLTDDTSQTGTVFSKRKVLRSDKSFKTDFAFSLHDSATSQGDGMAFFVQSEGNDSLGDGGGGLGYGSIGDSLAVEFDLFDNDGAGTADIGGNEVAVTLKGKAGVPIGRETPSFPLYNCDCHAWVTYKAKSKRLKVFVDSADTKPAEPMISVKKDLSKVLRSKSYAGFTAATGGSSVTADIQSWKLTQ